jgi:hypothetical protein
MTWREFIEQKSWIFSMVSDEEMQCKVVETKPTETTWIQIGPAAFKSQADAEKQIKTVCVEK